MDDEFLEPDGRYAMKYKQEQWMALVAELEKQGGAWMEHDRCLPELIEYKEPQKDPQPDRPVGTQACSNETMLLITYERDEKYHVESSGFVIACGVCDGVGAWPRFEKPVRKANSEYWDQLEWEEEDE